jgi:hypothetical protein
MLSVPQVMTISRSVVSEMNPDNAVIGAVSASRGSGRIELLVHLAGCHDDPEVVMLNLTRSDWHRFEVDLRSQLREAVRGHTGESVEDIAVVSG